MISEGTPGRAMKSQPSTMKKINWTILGGCGLLLFIAAHGLVAWYGVTLSDKIGGRLVDTRLTMGKSNAARWLPRERRSRLY